VQKQLSFVWLKKVFFKKIEPFPVHSHNGFSSSMYKQWAQTVCNLHLKGNSVDKEERLSVKDLLLGTKFVCFTTTPYYKARKPDLQDVCRKEIEHI